MNIIINKRFLSFLETFVPSKMNPKISECLFEDWVYLWYNYLRWLRHHWLEYPIQLSPKCLVQPFRYVYLCLKEVWCESCETLDYLGVYLLANFRGFKAVQLFINLLHQKWTQDRILLLVHEVDPHGIVPVGITFDKSFKQFEAKHLPLLGSYKYL